MRNLATTTRRIDLAEGKNRRTPAGRPADDHVREKGKGRWPTAPRTDRKGRSPIAFIVAKSRNLQPRDHRESANKQIPKTIGVSRRTRPNFDKNHRKPPVSPREYTCKEKKKTEKKKRSREKREKGGGGRR